MLESNEEIKKIQEVLFHQISCALTVPTQGTPLNGNRKWIIPCPDPLALADYPGVEKLDNWLKNWTACCPTDGRTDPSTDGIE